eukprot:SAG31_NODE_3353_length_4370_cov_1.783423_4_plen_91_part_00
MATRSIIRWTLSRTDAISYEYELGIKFNSLNSDNSTADDGRPPGIDLLERRGPALTWTESESLYCISKPAKFTAIYVGCLAKFSTAVLPR